MSNNFLERGFASPGGFSSSGEKNGVTAGGCGGRISGKKSPAMIKRLFLSSFVFAILGAARADLTILQEITSSQSPKGGMVSTTKWKGEKIRMDTGSEVSMIMDGKTGETVTLMHRQKMAVPVSAAVRKMAGQLAEKAAGESTGKSDLKATGRKETIAGFPCEEYAGTVSDQQASIWITKEVPEYSTFVESLMTIAPQLKQIQGQFADNPSLQGLPMLTEITGPGGEKTTLRVMAVSRDPIPEEDFKIPKDYRKMEMPQIPGLPAGQ